MWSFEAAGVEVIGRSFPNTFVQAPLLAGESLIPDTLQTTWSVGYAYNGLGQRVSETDPGNVTVAYGVNALG
jgi:YD repeat-containing protein